MTPIISIIIPVYNAERSLRDCINSVLDQGLEEKGYEAILVDDGSTDSSGVICDEFSRLYPCVRVIHQENSGPAQARNTGIKAAVGAFICFVDADDSLVPSGLKSLLPYCDGSTDVIRYWSKIVYSGATEDAPESEASPYFEGTGHDYLREYGLEWFCFSCLFRRQFLIENGLLFSPGKYGEDFSFMFDVLMAASCVVCIPIRIYNYFVNERSLSTTRTLEHSRCCVDELLGRMSRIRNRLQPYEETDPQLFNRCRESLDKRMFPLFSRILSSRYSVKEFRAVIGSCRDNGLLPITSRLPGKWGRITKVVIHALAFIPFLYPIASSLFSNVFMKLFYPKIDRDNG